MINGKDSYVPATGPSSPIYLSDFSTGTSTNLPLSATICPYLALSLLVTDTEDRCAPRMRTCLPLIIVALDPTTITKTPPAISCFLACFQVA